ncbi:hypothetical protein [Curtobacterium sp. VKM Ac-2887]|uniref:hypothetical protein n=1 Tax=Curtobacterium sp. VKM Ac-2887 TaxID=2783819 RepID=UPI00188AF747|nr:hypothetical protein [Curtobacterium sp. VKM Ac-2887]MBF4585714.1 hypothetical protein [Curtobacterium sp. VKM Ac-2887]
MSGFLLPLFFLIGLPLGLVSAFHAPSPHDLKLLVVGPEQVVTKITDGLDKTKQFKATQTDVVSEARTQVENRDVVGSIKITAEQPAAGASTTAAAATKPTYTVTTYVANAGGRSAAAAVEGAAANVASQLGVTPKVVDVAPLAKTDTLGTTLFYLLTYTSLGAYLTVIVLTQVMPKARLRVRFGAVAAAAVVAPLVVFGLSSIVVGDYGQSFGTIMALLGVDAISVLTVGTMAILIQSLLGNGAMFGIMATVVMLNFPSAGGAVPASMLPPFWAGLHNFWFGAGAYESFRSIVYFDGAQLGRWLPQLLAWTVGLILLTLVVHFVKRSNRQGKELEELRPEPTPAGPTHRHLQADKYETVAASANAADDDPQRSITTGTEMAR